MSQLSWFPKDLNWRCNLSNLSRDGADWMALSSLAKADLDFVQTGQLDRRLAQAKVGDDVPTLRLAILASCTVDQLLPGLRVAALRRGIRLQTYAPDYGQYRQEVFDAGSALYRFAPDVVLFSIDAVSLVGADFIADSAAAHRLVDDRTAEMAGLWRAARDGLRCQVIQQAALPVFPPIMGGAEHRAPGSPASLVRALNHKLRAAADAEHVDILGLDEQLCIDGLGAWYAAPLWHRAKQEISPAASPLYGELVMRIVDARSGHSAKCLVLDLDNTLWGGVIGDDGLEGIELGQGSAEGEAFVAFQRYVKTLAQRGVILAVCSKNDEANALEPFDKHPDMVLKRTDIASFFANWDDKATNLRRIAAELNIGIDALVLADDNPFERNILRRELPMVAVPELPEDPSLYAQCIASAGYFEAVEVTAEDVARGGLYQATAGLRQNRVVATDLEGYLKSLDMRLQWGLFDQVSMKRVTQLINKTNQFNLTTRRYNEAETVEMLGDPDVLGIHLRLIDRYADHGIIGVLIGRMAGDGDLEIDSWLMSCRVLGRGVEQASLAVLAAEARRRGHRRLIGRYRPSPKNGMVRDHYPGLGFAKTCDQDDADTLWSLHLDAALAGPDTIRIEDAVDG